MGRLSHHLAMQKAQEDIAGADEALMKLQNQLASHQKDKQSKQSVLRRPSVNSLYIDSVVYLESNSFLITPNSHLLPSRRQLLSNISLSRPIRIHSLRNNITPHTLLIPLAQCLSALRSALLVLPSLKRHLQPQCLHFPMRGR